PTASTLFPYTTLFRSRNICESPILYMRRRKAHFAEPRKRILAQLPQPRQLMPNGRLLEAAEPLEIIPQLLLSCGNHVISSGWSRDRKSTRLNSSHVSI